MLSARAQIPLGPSSALRQALIKERRRGLKLRIPHRLEASMVGVYHVRQGAGGLILAVNN